MEKSKTVIFRVLAVYQNKKGKNCQQIRIVCVRTNFLSQITKNLQLCVRVPDFVQVLHTENTRNTPSIAFAFVHDILTFNPFDQYKTEEIIRMTYLLSF